MNLLILILNFENFSFWCGRVSVVEIYFELFFPFSISFIINFFQKEKNTSPTVILSPSFFFYHT